jgi:hypothetical protein
LSIKVPSIVALAVAWALAPFAAKKTKYDDNTIASAKYMMRLICITSPLVSILDTTHPHLPHQDCGSAPVHGSCRQLRARQLYSQGLSLDCCNWFILEKTVNRQFSPPAQG